MIDDEQIGSVPYRNSSRRQFMVGATASLLAGTAMAEELTKVNMVIPAIPKFGKNPMIAQKVMVPMRDGVKLAMDLYFPEGKGPWPIVLQRTPYSRATEFMVSPYGLIPDAGYVYAVQDCRGKFDSEGTYRPFIDDVDDGFDTIEWLAAQSWSNGNVGMMGTSAMGINSYMAAMSGTKHLKACYVSMCRNPSATMSRFPGGIMLENGAAEWNKVVGLKDSEIKVPHIAEWTALDEQVDMRRFYSKIDVPMLHLGAWFDIHEQPLIDAFTHLQLEGAGLAKGNQKLVITPNAHIMPVKGVKFPGDTGMIWQSPTQAIRWFDHWMKGAANGVNDEPAVRYYLMGDTFDATSPGNEWCSAESWPPPAEQTTFYFGEDGSLAARKPTGSGKQSYRYDPNDPVPTVGGNNLAMDSGPMDQRPVSSRPDVLRFVSEPLDEAVEVAGNLKANLWVSTDGEDTDFIVKLIDIHPDGYEALVRDQGLRLRHREGLFSQTRVEPGKVYPIIVDLWSTALVFNKGHRIGVLVQSSNWPRFERHTNTWEPVAGYGHAVVANNAVHFGKATPSSITLPITKRYS